MFGYTMWFLAAKILMRVGYPDYYQLPGKGQHHIACICTLQKYILLPENTVKILESEK